MDRKIFIASSILSADFSKLKDEIRKVEEAGADMIHIDVMDGHFVPNITIGPLVIKAMRKCTNLILDTHLMIESPHIYIKDFAEAGSDIITVHAEAYPGDAKIRQQPVKKGVSISTNAIDESCVKDVLLQIKSFGIKPGISINPDSSFCIQGILDDVDLVLVMSVHPGFGGQEFINSVLPKIKQARKAFAKDIEVDGGISDKNAKLVIDAGANILVAGSYFFGAADQKEAIRKLRG